MQDLIQRIESARIVQNPLTGQLAAVGEHDCGLAVQFVPPQAQKRVAHLHVAGKHKLPVERKGGPLASADSGESFVDLDRPAACDRQRPTVGRPAERHIQRQRPSRSDKQAGRNDHRHVQRERSVAGKGQPALRTLRVVNQTGQRHRAIQPNVPARVREIRNSRCAVGDASPRPIGGIVPRLAVARAGPGDRHHDGTGRRATCHETMSCRVSSWRQRDAVGGERARGHQAAVIRGARIGKIDLAAAFDLEAQRHGHDRRDILETQDRPVAHLHGQRFLRALKAGQFKVARQVDIAVADNQAA